MKKILIGFLIFALLFGCVDNCETTEDIAMSELQPKIVEVINGMILDTSFAVVYVDNSYFVQYKYYSDLEKPYELDVPLSPALKEYGSQLTAYYDSQGIKYKRNCMAGSIGEVALGKVEIKTPEQEAQCELVFIDAYLGTPEEVAQHAAHILENIYGKGDSKFGIQYCPN